MRRNLSFWIIVLPLLVGLAACRNDDVVLYPDETPTPTGTASTPGPSSSGGDSYEYKVPSGLQNGATDNSYGFTLAPTATPTPTAPPLDLSVEED